LNEIKAQNLLGDFEFASDEEISALDLKKGFIGVKDLSIDLIVDYYCACSTPKNCATSSILVIFFVNTCFSLALLLLIFSCLEKATFSILAA
jgi:hypothetical protein